MKYLLIGLMAFMIGCTSEKPVQTEQPTTTTQAPNVGMPEKDMKMGSIIEVGKVKTWERSEWMDKAQACPEGAAHSKPCEDFEGQGCKLSAGKGLACKEVTTWNVSGYVYEKLDLGVKPLAGAKITQTWFAGCIVGFCDEWQVATTDENGFYEFLTSDLKDTMKASKEGYYGFCTNDPKMPISLKNGQSIIEGPPKKMMPLTMFKLTNDSCK